MNQTSLPAEAWIQLSQSPANCVALSFIDQSISSILVLGAASPWVDAILCLEFRAQSINIHGFHIASNGVFHLDTVTRIFEGNPLNAIVVLSDNQRGCCWNWTRSSIWVDTAAAPWDIVLVHWGSVCLMLRWSQRCSGARDLWYMRLHLSSGATSHSWLRVLTWVLLHLVLICRV